MNSQLAFLICSVGIAGLFFLDRDKSVKTSPALWLPVLYLLIIGSRPVSMWLAGGGGQSVPSDDVLAATLDGSPEDAAFYGVLIAVGILVLIWRKKKTGIILKANTPIIIYFVYCLISTVWSPFPEPSFKRWIKSVGDLVMVLITITDAQPTAALRRIFSRVSFLLFPLSVVFIKCTNLGVSYDELGPHYTGVTTDKNAFGMMLCVFTTGVVWNIRTLLLDRKASNRGRRLIAQTTLLGLGILLLQMAHSATSVFCFILGSGLILATGLPIIRKRPSTLHALCLGILVCGTGALLLGGTGVVTSALGRSSDFSGRTEIWAASLASADNPLIGTGFESFWNKNNPKVAHILESEGYADMSILNSAHNGYLQIYLDLGMIGVCLLVLILVSGYLRAVRAFRLDRELGSLFLAYLITSSFASITEADFRIMTLSWIFLLSAAIGATSVIVGVTRVRGQKGRAPRSPVAIEKIRAQGRITAVASAIRTAAQPVSFVCGSCSQSASLKDLSVHHFS